MLDTQQVVDSSEGNPVFAEKLAELQNLRNKSVYDITSLRRSLDTEQVLLASIDAQIELLRELEFALAETCNCRGMKTCDVTIQQVGAACDLAKNGTASDFVPFLVHARMKPGDAVITLLKKRPGLKMAEILDRLEFDVASSARDTRHSLRSTILNLAKVVVCDGGPMARTGSWSIA